MTSLWGQIAASVPRPASQTMLWWPFRMLLQRRFPGNAVAAVILSALLVHGLLPGPELFRANADITYGFMLTMLVTSGMMFVIGKLGARVYVNVLRIPRTILGPMILALTVVGIYAIHNSVFEVVMMLCFGVVGFAMERLSIPTAPAVLAVILGQIAEENLRRSLLISGDDFWYLLQGPISIVLVVLTCIALVSPWLPKLGFRKSLPDGIASEDNKGL